MCGIAAVLSPINAPPLPEWPFWSGANQKEETQSDPPFLDLQSLLPMLHRRGPDGISCVNIPLDSNHFIQTASTLLSMRGQAPDCFKHTKTCISSQNLLLFNGEIYAGLPDMDASLRSSVSDTRFLQTYLDDVTKDMPLTPNMLDGLKGPWSLIFWHYASKRLYFARDALGRRSLMLRNLPGKSIIITSVPPKGAHAGFVEIPPAGIAYIALDDITKPRFEMVARATRAVVPRRVLKNVNNTNLDHSNTQIVAGSAIDMYVSFLPHHWMRSTENCLPRSTSISHTESAHIFLKHFHTSIQRRLVTNRPLNCTNPRYGVLFSGGIDSMVMAAVLDRCLEHDEPLELINVAFGKHSIDISQCPDRRTALSGLAELNAISSTNRKFHLTCVDVTPEEADTTLASHVTDLLFPCHQPMDASIGTAIWLAACASGYRYISPNIPQNGPVSQMEASSARTLFSGLGADELMGGYKGRHRTIFRTEGVSGICREMDADLSRLWFRNLGRDDRLVGDHGKEVRHPFLDEDLIGFITSLPLIEHVCDLSKPDGIGDKQLLRRAALALGFSAETASRAKRAIQFGSRSKQVIERKRRE